LLTRVLNDRQDWRVRQVYPGNGWIQLPEEVVRRRFPSAALLYGEPSEDRPGLWAIFRDGVAVALVDETGFLHRGDEEPMQLWSRYAVRRRIDDVVDVFM
jgi:hypothetical protein